MIEFVKAVKAGIKSFSYHAVNDKGKRTAPRTRIKTEDKMLEKKKRDVLSATLHDAQRNMALLAWMIRKHLDYVTSFNFQVKTGDKEKDKFIEKKFNNWAKKDNCDIGRRHPLSRLMRLFEAIKTLDGDAAFIKINTEDVPKLQGVEGNRIAKPGNYDDDNRPATDIINSISPHGLILDENGAVDYYAINKRVDDKLVFEGLFSYIDIIFDGYFTRFDQTRGVSPLCSGYNTIADLYESFDYTMIKTKMHAMFGVVISSDGDTPSGMNEYDAEDGEAPDADTEKYKFDADGPFKLELESGDKAELLESKTPSTEFKEFSKLMMAVGMLVLDFPFSYFDASETNYSSMKAARGDYYKSAESKIKANIDVLNNITDWVLGWMYENGEITDNPENFEYEWISTGIPWIDENKEAVAAALRVASGFSSRQIECKKRGLDFHDVVQQLADEQRISKEVGASIMIGQPGQVSIEEVENQGDITNGQ